MSEKDSMKTISKAIQVLKSFSIDEKEFSLTELNHKTGLSKSSLQRILYTLTEEGFLEKSEKSKVYKLGIELYFLGSLVESQSHLLSIAKQYMEKLNERTEETITLNIVHQDKRKCIDYKLAKHELTTLSFISKESPLYVGASAKTLLANLPVDRMNQIIDKTNLDKITDNTVINKDELKQQLEKIRNNGYAISEGERVHGVYAISAPIKNRFDEIIASITITIPTTRSEDIKEEKYIEWVLECANGITEEF